jgi:hypothetical protein
MRYVACMLYITQHLHISHVSILPSVSKNVPIMSTVKKNRHAVTPCASRVYKVLCRNVDFLLTYTEKKIIRLYNKRER